MAGTTGRNTTVKLSKSEKNLAPTSYTNSYSNNSLFKKTTNVNFSGMSLAQSHLETTHADKMRVKGGRFLDLMLR